jgi:hypothetical protein
MKFKEIVKRLTGISSPIFGISWNPENISSDVAKRVISFLEDRRVLYNPSEMEQSLHCVGSVLEIRTFLTEQIPQSNQDELMGSLKAMRIVCRKFLDVIGVRDEIVRFGNSRGHWQFNGAIGELRGVFGIHIAKIAGMYGLDVENDLASIFPEIEELDHSSKAAKLR